MLIDDLAATAGHSLSLEGRDKIRKWLLKFETDSTREVFNGRVIKPLVDDFSFQDPRSNTWISCVFFCFPYIRYCEGRSQKPSSATLFSQPLVQALYRSESPFERELQQAASRSGRCKPRIIEVCQFWGFTMNRSKE